MPSNRDVSSPLPWPPLIFGSAAVVAWVVSLLWPWPLAEADWRTTELIIGFAVLGLGIALLLSAGVNFNAANTPIPPNRPTTAIVSNGIYKYTRNPMYLGMSMALAGLGFAFNQLWFLLALPIAIVAVTKLAIEREEAYLAGKFGADYLAYKAKVRRWL